MVVSVIFHIILLIKKGRLRADPRQPPLVGSPLMYLVPWQAGEGFPAFWRPTYPGRFLFAYVAVA